MDAWRAATERQESSIFLRQDGVPRRSAITDSAYGIREDLAQRTADEPRFSSILCAETKNGLIVAIQQCTAHPRVLIGYSLSDSPVDYWYRSTQQRHSGRLGRGQALYLILAHGEKKRAT